MEQHQEPVEIRLLGNLRVRRGDSSVVDASEWRTGKTLDLLRLLALEADQPVRIDSLLEKLWPDVDEARGRASLRTAASQIRRTLRTDCVARRLGGLVLTNAWVDVTAFRDLVVEARVSRRSGDHARVVGLTREAEALYLGDFEAHDGGSSWAVETRESLAAMRRSMLTDAAESAVELSWMRDAVDLAELAIAADPYSERSYRSLMRAYAGLGETDSALRVFNDLRTVLADELGVAPSRQTTALQMNILSAPDRDDVVPSWVGRDEDCSAVTELVRRTINARKVGLVCVVGDAGSGREALIDESLRRGKVDGLHVSGRGPLDLPSRSELECTARRAPVAVLPPLDGRDDKEIADLVNDIAALDKAIDLTLVVPVAAANLDPFLMELEMVGIRAESLETHMLERHELAEIAESVLCGHAAPRLLDVLVEQTSGRAGSAVAMLRRWLSEGQVIWTLSGLDLASTPAGDVATNPELGAVIRGILERVAPLAMDVTQLVALVNRPVTAATLLQLLDRHVWPTVDTRDIAEALDRLTDMGALRLGRAGYEFRHPIMRAATEAWVRPAARRRLHDRIARSSVVHESDRAYHWMQAAEPLQACDAAISSAREAQLKGDHNASRAHLAHGRDYADALSSTPEEQVAVLRQLSQVARAIGDHGLAEDAEVTALDMALSTGLPAVPENVSAALAAGSGDDTTSLDLRAWAAMLEDAIKRAVEPLLPGANLAIALSVSPAGVVPDQVKRAG